MQFQLRHLSWFIYVGLSLGSRYADNRRPAQKDSPQVAANFPDVEDVELLSPAFLDESSIPEGFADNQDGPTSQIILGETIFSVMGGITERCRLADDNPPGGW